MDEIRENNRKVIVSKRRGGKTETLFALCNVRLSLEGENVLFLSHNRTLSKFAYQRFEATCLLSRPRRYERNDNELKYTTPTGSITFKETSFLSNGLFNPLEYDYIVVDNAALDYCGVDVISVTGEVL